MKPLLTMSGQLLEPHTIMPNQSEHALHQVGTVAEYPAPTHDLLGELIREYAQVASYGRPIQHP